MQKLAYSKIDIIRDQILMAKQNNHSGKTETAEEPVKSVALSLQKKKLFYVIAVCICLLFGLVFFLYSLQKSIALDKAKSFLSLVDSGNYTDAYTNWLSSDYKNQQQLADFDLNLSLYNELIGKNTERKLYSTSFHQHPLQGTTDLTLTFHSTFTKDNNTEEIVVIKNSYWQGNWEIESYQLHSAQAVTY